MPGECLLSLRIPSCQVADQVKVASVEVRSPPCNDAMDCALTTCKPIEHRSHTTSAITLSTRPVQAFTPTSHSSPLFRPSTRDNHVAFPRESTTAFWFLLSNTAESKCCNHNPSTTPTLLQPMPACAAAAYMAYTMRARADMDAVQCY